MSERESVFVVQLSDTLRTVLFIMCPPLHSHHIFHNSKLSGNTDTSFVDFKTILVTVCTCTVYIYIYIYEKLNTCISHDKVTQIYQCSQLPAHTLCTLLDVSDA